MADQGIYEKFIEYMNNPVFEFTESEFKMSMITSFITPEEAEFLTGFPMSGKSLEEIAAMKEMDPAELAPKIKELCGKGLIYETIRGDSVRYKLWSAPEMFLRVTCWSGKEGGIRTRRLHPSFHYDSILQQDYTLCTANEKLL